jgi:hypothetical protein
MTVKKIKYQGWNCVRLANKHIEAIVTLDVGPRVIRFGFIGMKNEFKEYPAMIGRKGGSKWRIYGGHRLWHAPEDLVRTYCPDNMPVAVEPIKHGVRVIQSVEKATGIQKEMDICLHPKKDWVTVIHRLRNTALFDVELAPWALSVMAPGGTCVIPLPPRGVHPKDCLPCNTLAMWPYTDMSDPRWTWGNKYVLLRQESDPRKAKPQKIGAWVPDGWAAYANAGNLFVKSFHPICDARYPDLGCCFETFTNQDMLEVETVGPLVSMAKGDDFEHIEHWHLYGQVPVPKSDRDVDRNIRPKIKPCGCC